MKHRLPSIAKVLSKIFVVGVAVVTAGMLVTCAAPAPFGGGDTSGPDTTPPANVTDVTTTVTEGSTTDTVDVTLNWTNPTDSDFSHVLITWTPNGPDAPERVDNAATFTATALPALADDATYTFTIVTVDTTGNQPDATSGETGTTATVTTDTTPPASVAGNTISGSVVAGSASLSWTNPADADLLHVEITWAPDTTTAQPVISTDGTAAITGFATDTGTVYTFTLVAVDANNNRSAGADFMVTSNDGSGPAAVTDLTAAVTDADTGEVGLSWTNPADYSYVEITWTPNAPDSPVSVPATDPNPASATVTITGYDAAADYTFTATVFDANDASSPAATFVLDQTPPTAVTDLTAAVTDADTGEVGLSWTNPADYSYVEITWTPNAPDSPVSVPATDPNPASATVTITGYDAAVDYTFTATAFDAAGNASAGADFVLDQTPPTAVTDLTAAISQTGEASLSWTNPAATDFAQVSITWSPDTNTTQPELVTGTASAAGTATIAGFTPTETYTFTVVALDATGNISDSVTRTVAPDTDATAAVTDLTAAISQTGEASLSWTNPADTDFAQVSITWSPNTTPDESNEPVEVTGAASAAGTTTIAGFTPTVEYTFTVVALDTSGNTSDSATFVVDRTPPEAVTNLTAAISSSGEATLGWTNPADTDFAQVSITWSPDTNTAQPELVTGTASAAGTAAIAGFTIGQEYTFTVAAVDTSGNASATETARATGVMPIPDVTDLSGVLAANGVVNLSWTYPTSTALGSLTLSHANVTWSPGDGSMRVPTTGSATAMGSGTASIMGLTDGVAYTFTVKVEDSDGDESGGVTTTHTADAAAQPIVLTRTTLQNSGARLSWTRPTDPGYTPDGGTDSSKVTISWGTRTMEVTDDVTQVDITTGFTVNDEVSFTAKVTDTFGHESAASAAVRYTPVQGRVAMFTLGQQDGDFGFAACQTALDNTTGTGNLSDIAAELRSDGYTKAILFGSSNVYSADSLALDEDAFLPILAGLVGGDGPYGPLNRWSRRVIAYTHDGTSVVETSSFTEADHTAEATLGGSVNTLTGNWRPTTSTQTHTGAIQLLEQLGLTSTDFFWSFTDNSRKYTQNNSCTNATVNTPTVMGSVGGLIGINQGPPVACNEMHYVVCLAH